MNLNSRFALNTVFRVESFSMDALALRHDCFTRGLQQQRNPCDATVKYTIRTKGSGGEGIEKSFAEKSGN